MYDEKKIEYYSLVREEIKSLIPPGAKRLLDIGCGTGTTAEWIKNTFDMEWAAGAELFHPAGEKAKQRLDEVYIGNIEEMELPVQPSSIDVILCLDILEHLVNPWKIVSRLHKLLTENGVIITSIPNLRNLKVIIPLVLRGRFDYTEEGLLDKTHLRFFVRDTAVALMESSGMKVDAVLGNMPPSGTKMHILNKITLGMFSDFFVNQFIIRARNQ
ncbi:MAG: methyltransferase domain-containing protein [candidate division Zixibacteria bacterium]|nr:methyltransferase domain-containing protein [candidate division Zixibacteria bacterium]